MSVQINSAGFTPKEIKAFATAYEVLSSVKTPNGVINESILVAILTNLIMEAGYCDDVQEVA